MVQILFSVANRVMVSGLPSLSSQAATAAIVGLVEIAQRATMTLRDAGFQFLTSRCHRPPPDFYRSQRKRDFRADFIVSQMLSEHLAIAFSLALIALTRLYHFHGDIGAVLAETLASWGVQIAI